MTASNNRPMGSLLRKLFRILGRRYGNTYLSDSGYSFVLFHAFGPRSFGSLDLGLPSNQRSWWDHETVCTAHSIFYVAYSNAYLLSLWLLLQVTKAVSICDIKMTFCETLKFTAHVAYSMTYEYLLGLLVLKWRISSGRASSYPNLKFSGRYVVRS